MREPDFTGRWRAWRAWRAPLHPKTLEQTAATGQWLLHCPGAHPFWSYWCLAVVHLREIEGTKPAYKKYPDAQHELQVLAIHPDALPDPDDTSTWKYMMPPDVVEQFHGLNDEQTVQLATMLVAHVCKGLLSPDSDWRARWKQHVAATVEHMTTGHPVGSA